MDSGDKWTGLRLTSEGSFSSPNYPSNYGELFCRWQLQGSPSGKILIQFDGAYGIYYSTACWNDGLIINGKTYCGSDKPEAILVDSDSVLVQFYSYRGRDLPGFKITWTIIQPTDSSNLMSDPTDSTPKSIAPIYNLVDENQMIRMGTSNSCLAAKPLPHHNLTEIVKPTSNLTVSQCDPGNRFQTWTTFNMPDDKHMTICSLGKATGEKNNIICLVKKRYGKIGLERIFREDLNKAYDRFQFRFDSQERRLYAKGEGHAYVSYNYAKDRLWVRNVTSEASFGYLASCP